MVVLQLILVLLVLFGVILIIQARLDASRYQTSTTAELTGMCTAALDRTAHRKQNLDRIRQLLDQRETAANREIREYLGVSSRTVVRYMNDLIAAGEVEQVGETGVDVFYRAQK